MENCEKPNGQEVPSEIEELKYQWEILTQAFATFVTMRMSEVMSEKQSLSSDERFRLDNACLGGIEAASQSILKGRGIDPNQRIFSGTPVEIEEVLMLEGPRYHFRIVGETRWDKRQYATRDDAFDAARKMVERMPHDRSVA